MGIVLRLASRAGGRHSSFAIPRRRHPTALGCALLSILASLIVHYNSNSSRSLPLAAVDLRSSGKVNERSARVQDAVDALAKRLPTATESLNATARALVCVKTKVASLARDTKWKADEVLSAFADAMGPHVLQLNEKVQRTACFLVQASDDAAETVAEALRSTLGNTERGRGAASATKRAILHTRQLGKFAQARSLDVARFSEACGEHIMEATMQAKSACVRFVKQGVAAGGWKASSVMDVQVFGQAPQEILNKLTRVVVDSTGFAIGASTAALEVASSHARQTGARAGRLSRVAAQAGGRSLRAASRRAAGLWRAALEATGKKT